MSNRQRMQDMQSQKGEIEFRKKLVQHQVEGQQHFEDEFNADEIEKILLSRMEKTLNKMNELLEKKIVLSPYIEIGAERCQRSLVMENDLALSGAAVDLSYDMLKSGEHYARRFNRSKLPLRVCADVNRLPFRSNSIPFVFCYETLHHFPDPSPVIREIHRVLSPGGCFYFDEEPYKKVLHVDLYRGNKMYSKSNRNLNRIRKLVDYFLCEETCNETEHGIIENHDISVGEWKKALGLFDAKDIKMHSLKGLASELFSPNSRFKFILSYLLGGSISGTCFKSGKISNIDIRNIWACPVCLENGRESGIESDEEKFLCRICGLFPVVDGVLFLLSRKKLETLYPEVSKKFYNDK
jgi:SAM-dependent methyltransferase